MGAEAGGPDRRVAGRHAVLGAGAVGLAIGAALARRGHAVTLVMRPASLAAYPGAITVASRLRPGYTAPAAATAHLADPVDVLWVTVKAPGLAAALDQVAATPGLVVPLLNGLDHLPALRARFGERVVAGAIRIEAERTAPGTVSWPSAFAAVDLAAAPTPPGLGELRAALVAAGLECTVQADPGVVLWRKLALLLPLALATTAAGGPLGVVRRDPRLRALLLDAARETCAVAASAQVPVDLPGCLAALAGLPGRTDTSLHRDAAAGRRPTELAAIAGPVQRLAAAHQVAIPAIAALVEQARRAGG